MTLFTFQDLSGLWKLDGLPSCGERRNQSPAMLRIGGAKVRGAAKASILCHPSTPDTEISAVNSSVNTTMLPPQRIQHVLSPFHLSLSL